MYQFSYAEIVDDAPSEARARERDAFDHAIRLLRGAKLGGVSSRETTEALSFLQRLWSILTEDLASPENALPDALRANLISIGVWSMREADRIRQGKSSNFDALIDISTLLRDGLN